MRRGGRIVVLRVKQKITSHYGKRWGRFHRGIDLRTWNLAFWKPQAIVFPEKCEILRIWEDDWGGGIAVKPLSSVMYDELKFIHLQISPLLKEGQICNTGLYMGHSSLSKLNKSHHLHFETWVANTTVDPTLYLDHREYDYD